MPCLTPVRRRRSIFSHEDAERMTRQVGVHEEWLIWIVRSITEQARAKVECSLVLDVQLAERGNGCVEMQHLRQRTLRPGGLRQVRHLLERKPP